MKKPNRVFIDLFAGCGGLSLGLEEAGFFPLFVNEVNASAMDTYLRNRMNLNPLLIKYRTSDIKHMIKNPSFYEDLAIGFMDDYEVSIGNGDVDLVVGGPPCQGFSGIGHRRTYSTSRSNLPSNHLYKDMAYVIGQIRPKLFLFENVRGLMVAKWTDEGKKGEIWEDVISVFSSISGYSVHYALIHAKDYGVPQNRPRVLLVGVRDDLSIITSSPSGELVADGFLPTPSTGYPDLVELLGDLIDPEYENGGVTTKYPLPSFTAIQSKLREDPITKLTAPVGFPVTEHEYSKHSLRVQCKFEYMINNDGQILPEMGTRKFSQRLLPAIWEREGPTITATSMPDDYVHFSQPRTLTVREWARLQLFPDWYQFSGKRTTGGIRRAGNPREGIFERELPKYTQIGNAVPVGLAKAIGLHFAHLLDM